jgi:DNA primase
MVTFLFDGDAAGVAAASKAALAILPSGLSARVALLDGAGGKTDPDEFARTRGLAAVEALLASAVPLTEYLIDRAVAEHCGADPRDSSYEQRIRAVRQLKPLLEAVPKGLARSLFEERIAKRIDVSVDALSADVGSARPVVANAAVRASPVRTRRADDGNWALYAVGVLAAFPVLAETAREEHFLDLFLGTPLENVVRRLVAGESDTAALLSDIEPHLPAGAFSRIRKLTAEARAEPADAEREFRKAVVEAKIDALGQEIDHLSADVARAGSPVPAELVSAMQVARRRRADLEKRRDGRRPG